jgi:hypothetical protein
MIKNRRHIIYFRYPKAFMKKMKEPLCLIGTAHDKQDTNID